MNYLINRMNTWRGASWGACPTCQRIHAAECDALVNGDRKRWKRISHKRYVHQEQAHGIPLWDEPEQLRLEAVNA